MNLEISKTLSLPPDAGTQKIAFLGRTGSGKTYAAQKLAEEMLGIGSQVVVIDPVGVWYGLRIAADGKGAGIPIRVFGGLHGDVPLEAGGGELIANLIVDRAISAVIDVSQFEHDTDKARFAADFARKFFFRRKAKPSPTMLFLEECQEFIPQNPQASETRMLHDFSRLGKIGRNYGIGLGLISQRPQEVNKKVLNMTECMFAFQMTGPHERKTIRQWVEEKGAELDIVELLPKLEVGQAHVWSPQWLKISETVKIGKKWTFNASSTPSFGSAKTAEPKPLDAADLEKLRLEMADTIERAKSEDPKELRRRISELERSSKAQVPAKAQLVDPDALKKEFDRGVLSAKKSLAKEIARYRTAMEKILSRYTVALNAARERLDGAANELAAIDKPVLQELEDLIKDVQAGRVAEPVRQVVARPVAQPPVRTPSATANGNGHVSKAGRKVLTALAQFGESPDTKVGALTGYSAGAGHFSNVLSELRAGGYIDGERSRLNITDAGMDALGPFDPLPTGEDLQAYWIQRLPKGSAEILRALVAAYPKSLTDEELGERTGYSAKAGHFSNCLSELRTRDLIAGSRNDLSASADLF